MADEPEGVEGAATQAEICPRCAEEVKAAAMVCRYCGHEFAAAPRDAPRPQWAPPAAGASTRSLGELAVPAGISSPPQTSVLALGSLVTACIGLWFLAIPLGLYAQSEIDAADGRLAGRGLATAGVVIGSLAALLTLFVFASVLAV